MAVRPPTTIPTPPIHVPTFAQTSTNATTSTTTGSSTAPTTTNIPLMPLELEQTLATLSSHRSVLGYLLLSSPSAANTSVPLSIIKHSGVIFEGEQGKKYASVIGRIVATVQNGLEEVNPDDTERDDVKFMRIRTKRHELMISPGADGRYLLVVLHDPGA